MKKKILILTFVLGLMLGMTGCADNYKVRVYRGATKNSTYIYYNENYEMEGYEWNGTDLIIHFKSEED